MSRAEQTVVRNLGEARSSETALANALRAHIAVAPRSAHRRTLEAHLRRSEDHIDRIDTRLRELGRGRGPLAFASGLVTGAVEQALALGTAPLRIARRAGEGQVLSGATEDCAKHAHAIATYTAVRDVARALEDQRTAKLAATLRDQQQKMLDELMHDVPRLAAALVNAEVYDSPSYDAARRGSAAGARKATRGGRPTATTRKTTRGARPTATTRASARARKTTRGARPTATTRASTRARKTARAARKVPGAARAEGELEGARASEQNLPISSYSSRTAAEIVERLAGLSQVDLAKIDAFERRNENRATITSRIASLRGEEPWPGYDELSVPEVRAVVDEGGDSTAKSVASYERAHQGRSGVLEATERELTHSGPPNSR